VTLTNLYIEGNNTTYNAGVQIGDGGLSTGNTDGSTQRSHVSIIGGLFRGSTTSIDGVRILNSKNLFVSNLIITNGAEGETHFNYGGSNHDAQGDLTVSPGGVVIMGSNSPQIVNNGGTDNPDVTLFRSIV